MLWLPRRLMRLGSLLALAGLLAGAALSQAGAASLDLASLLPTSGAVEGWRMQGKPASYTPSNLYDYIDGGADFYLSYDFRRAVVADYGGPSGAKITVELYDMGSSYDAFGVFAHEQAEESPPVGQESSYAPGLLTFWKNRVFARIFADRSPAAMREPILRLGKLVATRMRATGPKPPLLRLLPRSGLAPRSVRYLHTDTALNSVLYLPGNPLRLNPKTKVVYGEYPRAGGAPVKLLIADYPDARQAAAAYSGVAKLHGASGAKPETGYARATERYKWVAGWARGRYVVVVSNAPDEAAARRLLHSARKQIAAAARS